MDGCERLHQLVGGETLVIIPLSVSCFLKSAKRYKKGCRISQPSTACMKRVLLCGLPTKYIQKRIRFSNFTSAIGVSILRNFHMHSIMTLCIIRCSSYIPRQVPALHHDALLLVRPGCGKHRGIVFFSVTRPGDFEVIKPWDWGCCFFLHEHRSFCFGKRGEQRLMMDGSEL